MPTDEVISSRDVLLKPLSIKKTIGNFKQFLSNFFFF